MPLIKLLTNNNQVHEMNVKTIYEIDGVPYDGDHSPDTGNHEDRIRILERLVSNTLEFLDDKFPPPSLQEDHMVDSVSGNDPIDLTVSDPVLIAD